MSRLIVGTTESFLGFCTSLLLATGRPPSDLYGCHQPAPGVSLGFGFEASCLERTVWDLGFRV